MPDIAAFFLVLTAVLAYLNHRYVGLPTTIGVMGIALLLSLGLMGLNALGVSGPHDYALAMVKSIDFTEVLMQGMLSVLLFAGALHVDLSELKEYRWQVGLLAVLGTVASAGLVGFGLWYVLPLTGVTLALPYCLLFGALISPTDPIAVMGILKSAGAPRSLELVITGESLFNDGMGVVLFALLLSLVTSGSAPTLQQSALVLLREGGGGILFGLAVGYVAYRMLKSIDSYEEEVLITLAAVFGGYELASRLHVSGPLAMVVVGLIIGNHGREFAMSDMTRRHIDTFWHLLDGILNSVLFVLIGLEVILFSMTPGFLLAIAAVIIVTLLVRLVSVGGLIGIARPFFHWPQGSWQVLTWGGLRGGISVALALALPRGPEKDIVLTLTYAVVVFSILCQGLTIGALVRKVALPYKH